jgi:integrase
MRKAEVSPATVNRELACLKTLFNKAVEWGKAETSPAAKVKKFRENNARERILSPEEARRLIGCAAPAIRPVLIVALNTGMRRTEILSLKWRDVDFAKSFILIEDSKSGKSRKVPMNTFVYRILKDLPRTSSEYVFFNPGTNDHVKDIKTGFWAACRRAGLSGVRLHDLRHTAASKMIEAGADLVTVSKILGHSSIQMTMRYAHPTPENMRLAVGRLGEILDPSGQKADSPSEGVVEVMPSTYLEITN